MLWSDGLAGKSAANLVVRLGHHVLTKLNRGVMADRLQTPRAAWRSPWPRVASALPRQATTRPNAASNSPTLARNAQRLHFRFPGSSFAVRSARKHSSSAAVAVDGTNPCLATQSPPQPLHHHLSDSLRPPVPADHIR